MKLLKVVAVIFIIIAAIPVVADTDVDTDNAADVDVVVDTIAEPAFRRQPSALSYAVIFPAFGVSYNIRNGYRKFDGIDEYQQVSNTNPLMYTIMAGKRFPLGQKLRIQAGMEIGWGSVQDDEFNLDLVIGNVPVVLRSNYFTYGAIVESHLLFPAGSRTFFLAAGTGLHVTSYESTLTTASDDAPVEGSGLKVGVFSPSINIGAGMEYRVSSRRAVAISYNFRFWQTAKYIETGALFPMGADYTEYFYSHIFQVQVLLPDPKQGRFR